MSEPTGADASDASGRPKLGMGAKVELHIPEGHRMGEELSLGQRALYRLTWYVVQAVGRSYFRLQVVGAENVPRSPQSTVPTRCLQGSCAVWRPQRMPSRRIAVAIAAARVSTPSFA